MPLKLPGSYIKKAFLQGRVSYLAEGREGNWSTKVTKEQRQEDSVSGVQSELAIRTSLL